MLWSLGFCSLSGCRTQSRTDQLQAIRNLHSDLLHGDLALAQSKIAELHTTISSDCAECDEQLRLAEAELYTLQGRGRDVLAVLDETGRTKSLALSDSDERIKERLFLSLANSSLGHEEASNRELLEAQGLAKDHHSPLQGEVLRTTGIIEVRLSNLAAATKSFQQSLDLARLTGDEELEAGDLLNLGYLALQTEHYGEALDWFTASSKIAASIGAQALLEVDLGNAGWAYYKLGDYELALTNFQNAYEQSKKLGVVYTEVGWLENAGLCLQRLGNPGEAELRYKQALQGARNLGNNKLIADIDTLSAQLALDQGRLATAKSQAGEALNLAKTSGDKSTELDAEALQARIAIHEKQYAAAENLLTTLYQEAADAPSLRWGIENALANLSIGLGRRNEAETWYRQSIATFEAQRSSVKNEELRMPFFANGDDLYRDYAEFLMNSHKSDQALELLDLGRARTLSEGLGRVAESPAMAKKVSFNPRSVARDQDATILFYSLGADKSRLWVIDSKHIRDFVLPKKAEIESQVASYQRAILKSSDPLRGNIPEANELYNSLIAPETTRIAPNSRVIVIPDGSLDRLNFETLIAPGKDGPHYWIDDVTISDANSIRLLSVSKLPERTTTEKRVLLVGDPIPKGTEYEHLANASAEIRVVEDEFPEKDRTVLTQSAAVPPAYILSKPDQYSYIHFVAHGTASQSSPLDSAVVLSPSASHPDNYKLYARDIVHQPIHADLVTISACYGSGVRSYVGEGLVGLSWAFLRAGSHNVIGALWNVDDASTPQLMGHLYRELRSGSHPDAALRSAKLSMVHSEGVYRKPLYWAAFQIYAGS
jgi:CHAT domain-containing protein/Flp pilus assembly protein TadD